ncbi:MAG: hypothetical protein KUG64_10315 [Cycloclasticus sp.]|nr:hypothetical protein [Cycloclasticus sp.]
MAEEIEVIVDDTQEEVSLFVGEVVGITKHSQLDLDDGTNPHGTTLADVNDGFIAKTNVSNVFTEAQVIKYLKALQLGEYFNGNMVTKISTNAIGYGVRVDDQNGNQLGGLSINVINGRVTPLASTDIGVGSGVTWKELFLSSYANVLGVKSSENDPTKVFATDGSVINVRQDDRLNVVGNINSDTLALDFDAYEGWDAVLTEDLTLSITNGKFKVVTVDLSGDFTLIYPANTSVVGDTYDGNNRNTLTIHYTDASNILIIVTNWE